MGSGHLVVENLPKDRLAGDEGLQEEEDGEGYIDRKTGHLKKSKWQRKGRRSLEGVIQEK